MKFAVAQVSNSIRALENRPHASLTRTTALIISCVLNGLFVGLEVNAEYQTEVPEFALVEELTGWAGFSVCKSV